jgi:hypothetical protein
MDWCHDVRFWVGLQQDQVRARPVVSQTFSCGVPSDVLLVITTLSVFLDRAELPLLLLAAVTLLLLEAQGLQVDCTTNSRPRASSILGQKSTIIISTMAP